MTTAVAERPVEATAAERPIHLAKCAECAQAVKFQPTASGASFLLVDADPEATFGIGEHGRPMCPDGHGEMEIADDQLKPAAEAFREVARTHGRAAATPPVQRIAPGRVAPVQLRGRYAELDRPGRERRTR
jgi:hypothetical protein